MTASCFVYSASAFCAFIIPQKAEKVQQPAGWNPEQPESGEKWRRASSGLKQKNCGCQFLPLIFSMIHQRLDTVGRALYTSQIKGRIGKQNRFRWKRGIPYDSGDAVRINRAA